jgi:atypical dual specificity phosphatase
MSAFEKSFSLISATLAGCSAPGLSGTSAQEDKCFLESQGVVALISLNESELDWTVLAPLAHFRCPVEDYRSPSILQLIECKKFWETNKIDGGIVAIHCNAGMGRTGTVLAALMISEDPTLSADAAIKKIRELRKGSVQTYKQEDGVRAWKQYLDSHSTTHSHPVAPAVEINSGAT